MAIPHQRALYSFDTETTIKIFTNTTSEATLRRQSAVSPLQQPKLSAVPMSSDSVLTSTTTKTNQASSKIGRKVGAAVYSIATLPVKLFIRGLTKL